MAATSSTELETRTEKVDVPAEAEAEASSQAQQPSSSLLPLLWKLHLPPKWKARWIRKEEGRENEQQSEIGQEELEPVGQQHAVVEQEEEEETNEESVMIRRDSQSTRSSGSVSYSYYDATDINDGSALWSNMWRRIRRFPPFGGLAHIIRMIAYHHILMAINTVAMIMLSILVAGCSSRPMRNIYLMELSYQNDGWNSSLHNRELEVPNPSFYSVVANISSTGNLAVRVGYFGLCMATNTGGDPVSWICRGKAKKLVGLVEGVQDPLNILAIADSFRDEVIVSVVIIIAIVMTLVGVYGISTFPGWQDSMDDDTGSEMDVKPLPSMAVSILILAFESLAVLFLITAILWQHVAAVAHSATAQAAFNSIVRGDVGGVAMGLGWGSIGLKLVAALGLMLTILSLRHFRMLIDDDDESA
ncbi:membrane fusion mating FIG1 protein [Aspergillus terreus]|uniref:Membrane fusion mating FIG1 protein n=1 Tax=Aspergillus terreus TaxID=33178 RepID=A0A5M3Z230_ASPTE|nr:hypothetical protein ATETN484_0005064000 [Aspergillus terreus]GFF17292.1 membrane fusion mating FIG1 protein [Aspergillus terreus]